MATEYTAELQPSDRMKIQHCEVKMEQESDHSHVDHSGAAPVASEAGSGVSVLEERVRALLAEKDQVVADLERAKLAVESSERELAEARQKIQELAAERDQLASSQTQSQSAVEASEQRLAATKAKIQELNSEKNHLAGQLTQARSAIGTAERKLVAATTEVRELTKEKEKLVADKEGVQAQANLLRDKLRALDDESLFDFIRRRYFGQK